MQRVEARTAEPRAAAVCILALEVASRGLRVVVKWSLTDLLAQSAEAQIGQSLDGAVVVIETWLRE